MIFRRDKPDAESPSEKIARLEAAITALTDKLDRHIKHAEAMDRLADRSYDQLESAVCDTVERIKNMELRVFPNLATICFVFSKSFRMTIPAGTRWIIEIGKLGTTRNEPQIE